MKQFILIVFLAITCSTCRSVFRSRSAADSTATRSQESSEKFTRETIREYLPGRTDTLRTYTTIEVPKPYPVPGPTLIRETVRETGERQQTQTEQKEVAVQQSEVKKEPLPWWVFVAIGVGGMLVLLVIAAIGYLIVKVRSIPASIITKTIT